MSEKPKILVAEDDELVLSLISEIDEYDITTVTNGEECLSALESGEFVVVILDVLMPKISGLSVLRTLRQDYPQTGVVVVTGYADILRQQITEIGVDSFIEKPFTLSDIRQAVNAALESRGKSSPS